MRSRTVKMIVNVIATDILVVVIFVLLHFPVAIVMSCAFGPWGAALEGTEPTAFGWYTRIGLELALFAAACLIGVRIYRHEMARGRAGPPPAADGTRHNEQQEGHNQST